MEGGERSSCYRGHVSSTFTVPARLRAGNLDLGVFIFINTAFDGFRCEMLKHQQLESCGSVLLLAPALRGFNFNDTDCIKLPR